MDLHCLGADPFGHFRGEQLGLGGFGQAGFARGAQARSDYPNRDDANWLKHTLWFSEGNRLDYKPVNLKPLSVEAFPPKARTY